MSYKCKLNIFFFVHHPTKVRPLHSDPDPKKVSKKYIKGFHLFITGH
jgi:hypothetical protein